MRGIQTNTAATWTLPRSPWVCSKASRACETTRQHQNTSKPPGRRRFFSPLRAATSLSVPALQAPFRDPCTQSPKWWVGQTAQVWPSAAAWRGFCCTGYRWGCSSWSSTADGRCDGSLWQAPQSPVSCRCHGQSMPAKDGNRGLNKWDLSLGPTMKD